MVGRLEVERLWMRMAMWWLCRDLGLWVWNIGYSPSEREGAGQGERREVGRESLIIWMREILGLLLKQDWILKRDELDLKVRFNGNRPSLFLESSDLTHFLSLSTSLPFRSTWLVLYLSTPSLELGAGPTTWPFQSGSGLLVSSYMPGSSAATWTKWKIQISLITEVWESSSIENFEKVLDQLLELL